MPRLQEADAAPIAKQHAALPLGVSVVPAGVRREEISEGLA